MAGQQGGQIKKTARHSAIYAVGSMLRNITGLVMLPIYTRYLTPADYGVVELLAMAIQIAGILVGLRISQAMFRYYILAEGEQEKTVIVSTVLLTVLGASSVGTTVLYISAEPLARLIFGNTEYVYELRLFVFTLVTNAIAAVGLSYLRARQKPVLFVAIGIVSLALQVTLNIIFVVMLEMHVTGVVYSALITGLILAITLALYVTVNVGLHYSRTIAVKLVRFVAPLIVASIGAFYVAYADKYFLRLFGGLTDVGLYALAARISSVLVTIFEAFNMSWAADRFEIVKREDAQYIYDRVFRFLSAALILIGAGLALFSNDFFRIMTSPEFYPAGYIVPIVILAAIANIYTIFCNFGVLYRERTGVMAGASWIKVAVASVGYIALIPYIGVYGAAATLALSNLVEFGWVYKQSTRLYDMGLRWRPVAFMFGAAVVCVLCGLLLPEGILSYFILRLVLFSGLVLAVYLMPIWKSDDREIMNAAFIKLVSMGRSVSNKA